MEGIPSKIISHLKVPRKPWATVILLSVPLLERSVFELLSSGKRSRLVFELREQKYYSPEIHHLSRKASTPLTKPTSRKACIFFVVFFPLLYNTYAQNMGFSEMNFEMFYAVSQLLPELFHWQLPQNLLGRFRSPGHPRSICLWILWTWLCHVMRTNVAKLERTHSLALKQRIRPFSRTAVLTSSNYSSIRDTSKNAFPNLGKWTTFKCVGLTPSDWIILYGEYLPGPTLLLTGNHVDN